MPAYILIFVASIVLTTILIFLLKKLAFKINLVNSQGIPYVGGLGMWLIFFLVSVVGLRLLGYFSNVIWGIALGSGAIVIFGIIDDYKKELSVILKFAVQIVATILLILFGIKAQIVYLGPLLNLFITFLWVLTITNAFNLLDISDGLAAGVATISSITFFIIAFLGGNPAIAILALTLAAVTLGFLRYNLPQATVYMGNSGSHFLGFVLAALAIAISYAPLERKIALACPILILGLPIFDILFVMARRAKNRRSVFNKSDDHFALRLLTKGYSHGKTIFLMYLFALFFSLSALIIYRVSNPIGIVVLSLVIISCLIIAKKEL